MAMAALVCREREQVEAMVLQDRLTLVSQVPPPGPLTPTLGTPEIDLFPQFLLECSFYFLVPGYYPAPAQRFGQTDPCM